MKESARRIGGISVPTEVWQSVSMLANRNKTILKNEQMKKISIATFFCALSFIGISQIDVTAAPLGLLWGDLSLGVDYCFTENVSAELGAGFGGSSGNDGAEHEFKNRNIQGTVKYYFNPSNGSDKFYIGGFIRSINRDYDSGENSSLGYKQHRIGGGFLLGRKQVSDSGILFDINLGVGRAFYDNVTFTAAGNESTIAWPDIMMVGKLGVGYRF